MQGEVSRNEEGKVGRDVVERETRYDADSSHGESRWQTRTCLIVDNLVDGLSGR